MCGIIVYALGPRWLHELAVCFTFKRFRGHASVYLNDATNYCYITHNLKYYDDPTYEELRFTPPPTSLSLNVIKHSQ